MRALWFGKFTQLIALIATFVALLPLASGRAQDRPARILYFTHSAGYRHEVIPASREILKRIGEMSPRFEVATSEDVSVFTAENLRRYGAVMFFTTGELPMNDAQKQALLDFVRGGGGFLGVHSATDTFYQWTSIRGTRPCASMLRTGPIRWSHSSVRRSRSPTRSIKFAISMSAARTYCCVSTQPRSISPATSSTGILMAGRWPGPAPTTTDACSMPRLGMRSRCGGMHGSKRCCTTPCCGRSGISNQGSGIKHQRLDDWQPDANA